MDQPAFPLFALFSTALGARAVIPDMDPSRPARVDPDRFIRTIIDQGVTYSFGSPTIWKKVADHCLEHGITLPIKKILMAGAPVSGELVDQVARIMDRHGEIHTPYGATEALPVASITGRTIVGECWPLTRQGRGVCVGCALPGIRVAIIRPVDGMIATWRQAETLGPGEIGEIAVRGPVVTRSYDADPQQTALAKIRDKDGFWHRMGDMGYLDSQGRLWFCGRKAHVVHAASGPLYTICCEAIFNTDPRVIRSALVGVGPVGSQRPVLLVEKMPEVDEQELLVDLKRLAAEHQLVRPVQTFMVHPGFPVDVRHNAKIFREKLAGWAVKRLGGCSEGL